MESRETVERCYLFLKTWQRRGTGKEMDRKSLILVLLGFPSVVFRVFFPLVSPLNKTTLSYLNKKLGNAVPRTGCVLNSQSWLYCGETEVEKPSLYDMTLVRAQNTRSAVPKVMAGTSADKETFPQVLWANLQVSGTGLKNGLAWRRSIPFSVH